MITLSHISFGYKKKKLLLNQLNLNFKPGHIYGLLGLNGAGKSSLLYQICGLLFPHKGSVTVNGYAPKDRRPAFLQSIYLLPEEIAYQHTTIKGYANINAPFYPLFDRQLFENLLAEFKIPTANKLNEMSFGQQKKAMIAFAVATNSKILIMDEPTNGLDIPSKAQFRKVMAGILKEDQTIIISTHQVKDLDNLIDHIIILDDQKIIINETTEAISEKLLFTQTMDLATVPTPLYQEGGLKGFAVLLENKNQQNSKLDIEFFFNAVLSNKVGILPLFN
jgi:ABC-2 type transport system ATP-binding protein